MDDYEKMLDNAYEKMPKKMVSNDRWEPPMIFSNQQGNQTIIKNTNDVVDKLRRDVQHLLKFLSKELATAGNYDGKRIILQGKFTQDQLNARLNSYVKEYIFCSECGKPDTSTIIFEGSPYKRCEVCGAKAPVKKI